MDENRVYQFKKVEDDLKDLKEGQQSQARVLGDITEVLRDIGTTMKSFTEISTKQIHQEAAIDVLKEDGKLFKQFMQDSNCKEHDVMIRTIVKSDDSQNKNTVTGVLGFLGILATGFITYFITKG